MGTSAAHSFRVDTTRAEHPLHPDAAGDHRDHGAGFRFDSTEAGATFECRLDGGAWTACSSPEVESGLGAGTHTFRVRATDAAGNTDATPATVTWLVNPALPALTLASPVGRQPHERRRRPASAASPASASATRAPSTVKVYRPVAGAPDELVETRTTTRSSLDGSWSVTASPELEDGHYWAYAEQDGSVGTAVSAATSFTVDTTPPHTTISSGPQGSTTATTASFGFGPSETGSTFECRLDAGAWGACTSPRSYTGLGDGVHTFDVRATDDVGNVDPTPASRTWTVDTSGAAVTLESPADNALTNDSTPLFSGHASTQAGDSDTVNVEIYRPVAGDADDLVQTLSVVRSAVNGSWSVSASPALADGTYVAYATQDDSNAETAYSAPRTFTVDATEPGVSLTTPAGGSTTTDTTPTLAGHAGTDEGDATTVSVELYAGSGVSGSPIQTLPATRSGGSWSIEPSALADGTYTARATQADAAGNTGTSVPRSFTVDTTGPDTAIDSGPSGNITATAADFGFSSPESGATFECKLDGAAWAACTAPLSYSALALGSHTFEVRALDALGNADATPASRTWTIDAPVGGGTGGGTAGGAAHRRRHGRRHRHALGHPHLLALRQEDAACRRAQAAAHAVGNLQRRLRPQAVREDHALAVAHGRPLEAGGGSEAAEAPPEDLSPHGRDEDPHRDGDPAPAGEEAPRRPQAASQGEHAPDRRGHEPGRRGACAWAADPPEALAPHTGRPILRGVGTVSSQLATRTLGRSELEVSVLGLGCNQIGRTVDRDGARRLIDECESVGVNLLDTADTYGEAGSSEAHLGDALAGARREHFVVATKFGMELSGIRARPRRRAARASTSAGRWRGRCDASRWTTSTSTSTTALTA